jgi:hypothetical protein
MRRTASLITALALTLTLAAPALASNVTSVGFTDRGTTLVAVGTIDGLDPTVGAQVNLSMAGFASVVCLKPGADTAREGVPVSQGGPATRLEPGESVFAVETYVPVVTPENAGCPGSTVAVQVVDVVFRQALIFVIQGGTVEQFGFTL